MVRHDRFAEPQRAGRRWPLDPFRASPSSQNKRAFWKCIRLAACGMIRLRGWSSTSAVTSSPRCAGRQWRKIASSWPRAAEEVQVDPIRARTPRPGARPRPPAPCWPRRRCRSRPNVESPRGVGSCSTAREHAGEGRFRKSLDRIRTPGIRYPRGAGQDELARRPGPTPRPGSSPRCCRRPRTRASRRRTTAEFDSRIVSRSAIAWQGWDGVGQGVDDRHRRVARRVPRSVACEIGADRDRVDVLGDHPGEVGHATRGRRGRRPCPARRSRCPRAGRWPPRS